MLKFSIVIPVYNTEKYLDECISSILQQTYSCYELVLVDDGSVDSSGKICDHYRNLYPDRVVVAHRENQGPFCARIYGMQIASGDVFCFLDSDDTMRADALELLADAFTEYQCDMVMFEAQETKAFLSRDMSIALDEKVVFSGDAKGVLYRKLIDTQELNNLCFKAVRRECVKIPDHFLIFKNIKHGEDLLMSAQFITEAPRIVFLKQGLYHYRQQEESTTHVFSFKKLDAVKLVHEELDKYIDCWGMPELKRVHNTRRLAGCVSILRGLLNNRQAISKAEFYANLRSLHQDPYFRCAYRNMEGKSLSKSYRVFAWCLYHKWYVPMIAWVEMKKVLSK